MKVKLTNCRVMVTKKSQKQRKIKSYTYIYKSGPRSSLKVIEKNKLWNKYQRIDQETKM
jgi:hypothetical protein